MTSSHPDRWQTVLFLFLSKFVNAAGENIRQKDLINAKNVDLANRFAAMVGDKTPPEKVKLTLLKALKQLEKSGDLLRIDDQTLQISNAGFAKIQTRRQAAMAEIARNFPAPATPPTAPA